MPGLRGWPARIREALNPSAPGWPHRDVPSVPTIFHVTHWKAGSQWLNKILNRCAGDRTVFGETANAQFLTRPLLPGKVYVTCYVSREQFYSVALPEPWYRFVVIRDLRDTLVSCYFSVKISHVISTPSDMKHRTHLNSLGMEDGLLYGLEEFLDDSARIQRSWLEAGEELIKYEDLLDRDEQILVPLLTRQCPVGVPAEQVREAVVACRFENLTGGRARGQEDVQSHERKGISGDWRGYFTDRVKREFKARFGDLLVAAGYEKSFNW